MYAQRSDRRFHLNPTSLTAALAINGGVLAALFLAAPDWMPRLSDPGAIKIRHIPLPAEPPEAVPEPQPTTEPLASDPAPAPLPRIDALPPIADVPASGPPIDVSALPRPTPPIGPGGTGTGSRPADPPAPVLVDAAPDPRYLDQFQPDYPAAEQREAREGRVVVRVLIGADGRVKAVERIAATSDAFYEATRRRALSRWRFRPATRDGAAVESWHRMTVRFEMAP